MLTVDLIDNKLSISFKYYPEYISRIKSLGAQFDPTNKTWGLDFSKLDSLLDEFEGELYFNYPKWKMKGEQPPDYTKMYEIEHPIDVSKLGFKLSPFKYQEFGIKFLVDRLKRFNMGFISDDMGLGKTAQAIGVTKFFTDSKEVKNTVIVCKKSIKTQWKDEFEKFINYDGDIYISDDSKAKRTKTYEAIKNNNNNTVLIINYHLLLKDAEIINELIKPELVVLDECHTVKTYNGKLNLSCRTVCKKAKYTLFMTGTPIMSRPEDIYGIISIKDKKYFGPLKEFKKRYIVEYFGGNFVTVVGYKHLDELREKIQNLILRRTADEVVIDLPSIVEKRIECTCDKTQEECSECADVMQGEIDGNIDKIKQQIKEDFLMPDHIIDEHRKKLEQEEGKAKGLIALRQIIANNPALIEDTKSMWIQKEFDWFNAPKNYISDKMNVFYDLVDDIHEAGRKVIVFTKYETVSNYLVDFLNKKKIPSVSYSGSLSSEKREEAINSFKNDPNITVIIGTDALAEGVSLQMANTVIHFDLAYNEAIIAQRTGRARRAGSIYNNVFVYYLITKDTIDETIYKKVIETKKTFNSFINADSEQSKLLKGLSN